MVDQLDEQYKKRVEEIKTEEYTMSVGELVNMYRDGDLTISPAYQRYYRWNINQKSAFIESLILGIPIPSIFVAQNEDGTWDVIDGLQRISTILQFIGILKKDNEIASPLITTSTKFLPALEGKTWDAINSKFRRIIKRQRISMVIIDASSNSNIKYELFQRLNRNGSKLTDQEIRNVLVLMSNKCLFNTINELSINDYFRTVINNMSTKRKEKQAHKELISEIFVLMTVSADTINANMDLGPFLTSSLIENENLESDEQIVEIKKQIVSVFQTIATILGENASKIYNVEEQKYRQRFSRPVFELTFMYTWKNLKEIQKDSSILMEYHHKLPKMHLFTEINKRGFRPTERIKRVIMTNGGENEKD